MSPTPPRVLTLYPPAKINLGLHVLGRRPDGYHDVRTVLQKLALRDRVTLTLRPRGLRVWCSHPDVPDGSSNLAYRAAKRLLRAAGGAGGAAGLSVYIEKRIPVAAGLGGGSADAAAVLFGLNALLRLGRSGDYLAKVAAELGADVPFFLGGPCALAEGKGERLSALKARPPTPVVIVKPPFSVSAAWAYGALNSGLTGPPAKPKMSYRTPRISGLPGGWDMLRNDLEKGVVEVHPIVGELKAELRRLGADFALMSGSGPTVFGWFSDVRRARRAARSLLGSGIDSRLTRTLGAQDRMF
ncbi:MAG: 4-(cytidine 5'-diphospho)-2-C-methyl-D-erythritol kinase [Nitrospinota bacterium]